MALLVVAPLVSRVALPASTPMSASMMRGMTGGDCRHAMMDAAHPCKNHGTQDPTDCCGYCVLLGQQSLLAACVILHLLPAAPREAVASAYRVPSMEPRARIWARPRGPPSRA